MASGITLKEFFFDRAKVIAAMDKKTHNALSKAGNFVKTVAQRSMRYGKKSSAAGVPPIAHKDRPRGPLLRKFLFNVYDTNAKTQVIGPHPLGRNVAPAVLEHGGQEKISVRGFTPTGKTISAAASVAYRRKVIAGTIAQTKTPRITKTVTYAARPYMGPAGKAEIAQMASRWGGELKQV